MKCGEGTGKCSVGKIGTRQMIQFVPRPKKQDIDGAEKLNELAESK